MRPQWSVRLARDGPAGAAGTEVLDAASQRLAEAAAALDTAQRRHPPAPAARRLLRAIPANAPPPRRPPAGGEPVPQLCRGAANTAERLRHLTHLTHPDRSGASAPLTTAASWQRTAQAAAITGHASELILRSLALRARHLGAPPATVGALRAAATPLARAWLCARAAARQWDTLTTGTTGPPAPAAADAADLVLWIGRLAYADTRWTPARRHTSTLRTPAGLAAGPGTIPAVLAAVHHAADAAARLLAADRETIRAAAATRQLFTPTRLLPDGHDIPYRYAPLPAQVTDTLLRTYDAAITTATRAVTRLDTLATHLGAPSTTLAMIRAAEQAPHTAPPVERRPRFRCQGVLAALGTLLVNFGANRDLRGVAHPFWILWSA